MTSRDRLDAIIQQQARAFPGLELAVELEPFFEGNEDLGSIGCNLGSVQPSPSVFYATLRAIRSHPSVESVLVRITDASDPNSWPYSDTVYIVAAAQRHEVESWVAPLLPDEVIVGWMHDKPAAARDPAPTMHAYSVWWD